VTFEAYGRRFEVLLEPNEQMIRALPGLRRHTEPLTGTLDGVPGSWARLTRSTGGRWQGVVFDGQDLYAIEPASDLTAAAVQPLPAGDTPVVYRLSDAVLPVGPGFCGTVTLGERASAQLAFDSLSSELQSQAATLVTRELQVGVVADAAFTRFFSSHPGGAEQAIVARMNIVDGIFSSQLGVRIRLAPPVLFEGADPFTREDPNELLDELRRWRRNNPEQLALGLTHLMTGRNMTGETVGIAYMGTVCRGDSAASLSEGTRSTTTAALIAAHEIGHNFNAPHDGEAGGACETAPRTFLMAPRLNGSDQFSACSVQQMQPLVTNARCLASVSLADAALETTAHPVEATVGAAVTLTAGVRAVGSATSQAVTLEIAVPVALAIRGVTAPAGGSCTHGGGTASCSFGDLLAGELRTVNVEVLPTTAGTHTVGLALAAMNDGSASNNFGQWVVNAAAAQNAAPAPPAPAPVGGSGGGGGRLDTLLLLGLGALGGALARRRRRLR
jgi:hypothetical protein